MIISPYALLNKKHNKKKIKDIEVQPETFHWWKQLDPLPSLHHLSSQTVCLSLPNEHPKKLLQNVSAHSE